MPRSLIVTADDFGLSPDLNEAVEIAHRHGILKGASLLVSAPAAADAVARARRMPGLRVGLHLAVVDAAPRLPPDAVPSLVASDGTFRSNLFAAGVAYAFQPRAREQLRREIRAQFEAFASFGLTLDHVNGHHHMQLHPTVAAMMIEIGREFGLRSVRVPEEPQGPLRRARVGGGLRPLSSRLLRPWVRSLRRRVTGAGLLANDQVFGIAWTGGMNEARWLGLLPQLPEGVSEIYCHPGAPGAGRGSPGGNPGAELAALTSPEVRRLVDACRIELTSFGELANVRRGSRA